jgi:cytidine deaminase
MPTNFLRSQLNEIYILRHTQFSAELRMPTLTNGEIMEKTKMLIRPHMAGDRLIGDVGATILSQGCNVYSGVCIDTTCGTGFCAEAAAIASMVTAGEYRIKKVVAMWKDSGGSFYVMPPCGRCREFIRQIDESNLDAEVILGTNKSAKLRELLPYHEWPEPVEPI